VEGRSAATGAENRAARVAPIGWPVDVMG